MRSCFLPVVTRAIVSLPILFMSPADAHPEVSLVEPDTIRTTIGVVDGDDREVFGRIREVETDAAGNVFVLDDQALVISWFGPDGSFRGRAGRAGGGPGEFRAPVGMAVDAHGRVHVLDEAYRRITVFEPSAEGLSLVGNVTLPVHGGDLCMDGDRYYVLAPLPQGLVHVFSLDGRPITSFGTLVAEIPKEMTRHEDILRQMQNRGRLVCVAGEDLVVFVPEEAPLLRAFRPNGSPVWGTRLEPFYQRRYELTRGGRAVSMAPDPQSKSAHTVVGAAVVGTDILVTLTESSLADPVGTLEWRAVALADGRQGVRRTASSILAGSSPQRFVTFANHPYPRVFLETVR